MNRAIVFKSVGDPETANAIVDGMTSKIVPLNSKELSLVKKELKKEKAINGVRQYGDQKRWKKTSRKLARTYKVRPMVGIRGTLLLIWAIVWLVIDAVFRKLQAWNREP